MPNCCIDCFQNLHVVRLVSKDLKNGDCDFCGSINTLVEDTDVLGKWIREKILAAYYSPRDIYEIHFDASDEKGERVSVAEIFRKETVFSEKLIGRRQDNPLRYSLLEPENPDDWYGSVTELQSHGERLCLMDDPYGCLESIHKLAWRAFKHRVLHYSRFFDINSATQTRDNLLSTVTTLFQNAAITLPAGERLYRARKGTFQITNNQFEMADLIGPPPPSFASNNRMSPQGIPYCYLSDHPGTCVKEIEAPIGEKYLLGEFHTNRDLRLLDLSHIPIVTLPSIFSDEYNPSYRWAEDFIAGFIREISKPLRPTDKDLSYVPTQVLCEAIRQQDYEGIVFESSKSRGRKNYTLFCGPRNKHYAFFADAGFAFGNVSFDLPTLPEFTDWVTLAKITSDTSFPDVLPAPVTIEFPNGAPTVS